MGAPADCAELSVAGCDDECQSIDAVAAAAQMTIPAIDAAIAVMRLPASIWEKSRGLRQRDFGSGCTGWAAARCSSSKTAAGGSGGESISCILLFSVYMIIPLFYENGYRVISKFVARPDESGAG